VIRTHLPGATALRATALGVIALLVASAGAVAAADDRSELIQAVKNGRLDTVRALIKQRANVNAAEADGTSALHWAVRAHDAQTANVLIRAGAVVTAVNRYGVTPLSLAATNGDAPMLAALLKAGANANTTLPDGETVLMTAARTGSPDAVKMLLAHGAQVDSVERTVGQTALMWAAAENHAAALKVLIEAGADVNMRSAALTFPPFKWGVVGMVSTVLPKGSWTPLMYAARQNAIASARALVASGADVNASDPDGSTPLLIAISNAHYDTAAALLELGADPNKADLTGTGPLYAAVDMHTLAPMVGRPSPRPSGVLEAPAIVTMLLQKGADPNAALTRPSFGRHHDLGGDAFMGDGSTPLMRAARTGDVDIMRLLLARGANPHARRRDLATALFIAASGRQGGLPTGPSTIPGASNLEAVTLLLQAGLDVNAFNANGQTALHAAAQRGYDAVVTVLVGAGAALDLRDKQKRTPLDLALGVGIRGQTPEEDAPVRKSTAALLRELQAKAAAIDRPRE
jgi:ankyrin repeat protein